MRLPGLCIDAYRHPQLSIMLLCSGSLDTQPRAHRQTRRPAKTCWTEGTSIRDPASRDHLRNLAETNPELTRRRSC